MPLKPAKPCKYPGCPAVTRDPSRYCPAHVHLARTEQQIRQRAYDTARGNSSERGYDAAWQKFRLAVKERDQWLCTCARCRAMDRIIPVRKEDPVHHIKPVSTHPHLRLSMENCESHSFHCHEVEEGRARDREFERWQAGDPNFFLKGQN
jgi:5-methylcytosine-specific restriction enzyme A